MNRIVVVLAVLVVMTTGCRSVEEPAPAAGVGSTPARAPVSIPPTQTRPAANPAIPDAVLLGPAELGDTFGESDLAYWRDDGRIPPRPCGRAGYPSDAQRTAERAVQAAVAPRPGSNRSPNVVVEYVARYRDNGAVAFMAELRAALKRCPGTGTTEAWLTVGELDAGDDALLIRYTIVGGYHGDPRSKSDQYLAVVRVGRVVLVLGSLGWEIGSGDEPAARTLAPVAANRLRPLA